MEARGDETKEIDIDMQEQETGILAVTPSKRKAEVHKSLSEQIRMNEELQESA